jgi:hypothetical protein
MFTLLASRWTALEAARAVWSLSADWSDVCTPAAGAAPHAHMSLPAWLWSASCFVLLSFVASALESTLFDCVTDPV